MLRMLMRWNDKRRVPITYIYQFDRVFVTEFLDYIYLDKRKLNPYTQQLPDLAGDI